MKKFKLPVVYEIEQYYYYNSDLDFDEVAEQLLEYMHYNIPSGAYKPFMKLLKKREKKEKKEERRRKRYEKSLFPPLTR